MKRKILLPTDFSKNAWNAMTYAIELYKDEVCEFYILNTFNATGYALANNVDFPNLRIQILPNIFTIFGKSYLLSFNNCMY